MPSKVVHAFNPCILRKQRQEDFYEFKRPACFTATSTIKQNHINTVAVSKLLVMAGHYISNFKRVAE